MNEYSLLNPKWLNGTYIPEATAYYYKTWNGFEMNELHLHDQVEIMYVLNGYCSIGFEKIMVRLNKGEFVIIDSGVPHRLVVNKGTSCRMINIEFGFLKVNKSLLSISDMVASCSSIQRMIKIGFDFLIMKDSEELHKTLKQLIMEYDDSSKNNSLFKLSLYYQILISIARMVNEKDDIQNFSASGYIKSAVNYIHQHYDQNIRISGIAKYISVNENYLQRIFKKKMGMTIIDYVTGVRMEKAKLLLKNTHISVTEICDYIGINSRQYFSKLFKKHFGLSPVKYRKANETLKNMSE